MRRPRLIVGSVGIALVLAALGWAATGLPSFGHYDHSYGRGIARSAGPDRNATNAVTLTTFDDRSLDTHGEECTPLIAVVGVVVRLRRLRDETDDPDGAAETRTEDTRASTSERWLGAAAVGPVAVLAIYIIVHGALTPGGGFQGGIVLMASAVFLALGGESMLLLRVRHSSTAIEMAEAAGAAAFTLIGFGGLIAGGVFFFNFIKYGQAGLVVAGVVPLDNIAVGVEVAGAVLIVTAELFDQRLRRGGG